MLSYKHGFHAGNQADIFKHAIQIALIQQLAAKPRPLSYIDSHSGRGIYDIFSPESLKTGEAKLGIAKLYDAFEKAGITINQLDSNSQDNGVKIPPDLLWAMPLIRLLGDIQKLAYKWERLAAELAPPSTLDTPPISNENIGGRYYPGSPLIAQHLLGSIAGSHINLLELHPNEFPALKAVFRGKNNVHLHQRDAWEGVNALVPPEPLRGLLLIDPPYEGPQDFERLPDYVIAMYKKWPQGVIMLWYPILTDGRERQFELSLSQKIAALNHIENPLWLGKAVSAKAGFAMKGSGIAVINPPYGCRDKLDAILRGWQNIYG